MQGDTGSPGAQSGEVALPSLDDAIEADLIEQMERLRKGHAEALRGGNQAEAARLYGEQNYQLLKRWVTADIAGADPMEAGGATHMADWDLVRTKAAAVMDKKLTQMSFLVNNPELNQRITALEDQANQLLSAYRERNASTLAQMQPDDPIGTQTERILALQPLPLTDQLYSQLTGELAAINRAAKQIDPSFNVYNHPRTAKLAHILTRTVGPSLRGYFAREDPEIQYNAFVPEALQDYIPDWVSKTAGRGASVAYNWLDGVAGVAGAVGVAAYDGATRLASFIEEQVTGQPSSWTPTTFFTQDESGNPIPLDGGRFSMPEVAGLIVGALTREEVINTMASFREAHGRQETFGDLSAQGVLNSIGNWVGSFQAFSAVPMPGSSKAAQFFPTGGRALAAGEKAGQWLANRQAVMKGTAWMFGSNSARAEKLRKLAMGTMGQAAALGTHDMLIYGNHGGMLNSWLHGAMLAPIMRVAEGVAGRGEVFLHRKNMPAWMSRAVAGMMEGSIYGGGSSLVSETPFPLFGPDSPEGRSLWELVKNPTDDRWRNYVNYVGEMILGAMVQRSMFGRRSMLEREAQSVRDEAQKGSRVSLDLAPEDLTGPGAGEFAQVLPQTAREGYREAGRRLRAQGELEAQLEAQGRKVEQGPAGYIEAGTENLMGRLMKLTRRRLGKRPTEVGAVSVHLGAETVVVPGKGEAQSFDPSGALRRLKERLGEEGFRQATREGRILSVHTHPAGDAPSVADLAQYLFKAGGEVPDLVVGPEGAYLVRYTGEPGKVSLGDVGALKEQRERWKTIGPEVAKRVGRELGMEPRAVAEAFRDWNRGKKLERTQREAATRVHDAYLEFIKGIASNANLDITFLDPQQLQRAWASYMDTGRFDAAAPERRHEAEARERFAARTGEEPATVPLTPSQQGELRQAYEGMEQMIRTRGADARAEEQEIDAFLETAEELFGPRVRDMARNRQSVRAILEAAGIEGDVQTPSPMPTGEAARGQEKRKPGKKPGKRQVGDLLDTGLRGGQTFGKWKQPDVEEMARQEAEGRPTAPFPEAPAEPVEERLQAVGLDLVERADGGFDVVAPAGQDVAALAEQARVDLVERPGGGYDIVDRTFAGMRSERFEPDSPAPDEQELRDLGRLEAGAVPRGTEALERMLTPETPDTPQRMYQRAKRAARGFAEHLGRFFKDESYRADLAKRLESLGYRRRFLQLRQDEEMVLAQTDRVRAEVRRAPERTRADRGHIFEPMLTDEALPPEKRKALIDETVQYAVLRDLAANYIREKRLPNGETIDVQSELPYGTTIEAIQHKIAEMESTMDPHVREAYRRMRMVLDDAWTSMARRGLVNINNKLPDYFPRRIKDWNDIFDALGPGSHTPPVREPIRGYLKTRRGSQRLIDVSLDSLTDYLTKVRVDNAWHDYANEVGWRIQSRLETELADEGIDIDPATIESMSDEEWGQLYEHLERDRGLIVVDVQGGRVGERTLERDPVTQKIMADIAAATGLPIIPEAVIGGFFKPNPEAGRYLVTKKAYEFLREARMPSGWYKSPLLNSVNRIIGKWFKGPALRGIGGLATPFRVARNLFSDATALFFKTEDGFKALRESLGQLGKAHRIIRAHTTGDDSKLTDYEKSMLEEMRYFGTIQEITRGAEFARDSKLEREWIQKVMPETNRLLETISMAARGDFAWAQRVDDYAENIIRAAYFLRERMGRFQELQGHPDADRLAAQDAHIRTGEVLVNYNHLTPAERMALNGVLFPFYTWVKGNFARTLGQFVRHPAKQAGRYGVYMAPAVVWNMLFAREEEERLWHSNPLIASRSHLIMPWFRDEFGNPFVVSFEDTYTEAARMLGMNTVAQDVYQFAFGHQSWDVMMREPVRMMDSAQQALNNWTAPWIRSVFGTTYKSKYETLGERAENTFTTDILTAFRPLADAQALTNTSKRDRSTGERWLKYAPFVGFVDISRGLPAAQLQSEHLAGRVQRRGAQLSSAIKSNLPRFLAGLVEGRNDQMDAAIESVWDSVGDELELAGLSKIHVIARFQAAAEREFAKRETIESGGILSPKFYQLSRTQQAEVLLDLLEGR